MDILYEKTSRSYSSFLKGAEKSVAVNSKQCFSQDSTNPNRPRSWYVSSLSLEPDMATEPFIQSAMRQLHLSAGLSRWVMAGPVGHLEGSSCSEFWRGSSGSGSLTVWARKPLPPIHMDVYSASTHLGQGFGHHPLCLWSQRAPASWGAKVRDA